MSLEAKWSADSALREEFMNDFRTYSAYQTACDKGRIKLVGSANNARHGYGSDQRKGVHEVRTPPKPSATKTSPAHSNYLTKSGQGRW